MMLMITYQQKSQYKNMTQISIIVAMDTNNLIGKNNQIPWKIPGELKNFRDTTMGNPIVMGRKTHESIGRVLDGRLNIVLSRDQNYQSNGVKVFSNLENILQYLEGEKEIFIIGGSQIYELALPFANKMYITRINSAFEGDAWFPSFDINNWRKIKSEKIRESKTRIDYENIIYERVNESL